MFSDDLCVEFKDWLVSAFELWVVGGRMGSRREYSRKSCICPVTEAERRVTSPRKYIIMTRYDHREHIWTP